MAGICLVHVTMMFHVTTQYFVIVYLSQSIALIVGSFFNGALFSRWPCELQFFIVAIVCITSEVLAPWTGSIYGFAALRFIHMFMIGYGETGWS